MSRTFISHILTKNSWKNLNIISNTNLWMLHHLQSPVRAFSISRTDCLGAQCNSLRFSFLRYNLKKKFAGQPLTSLLYDLNCFRMLFGISTIVFYIFILVSYFRSEHACFRNIPWKSENKIRPSLELPHFHEQGWKKKNKQIKKLTKLSITPLILFFKIMRFHEY